MAGEAWERVVMRSGRATYPDERSAVLVHRQLFRIDQVFLTLGVSSSDSRRTS